MMVLSVRVVYEGMIIWVLKKILYKEQRNILVVVTQNLILRQYSDGSDGKTTNIMKVWAELRPVLLYFYYLYQLSTDFMDCLVSTMVSVLWISIVIIFTKFMK